MNQLYLKQMSLVQHSYQLIRKDLGLEDPFEFENNERDDDRLVTFLSNQVNYLLDHDFNKLLNALYRIDIPENKVKELLHSSKQGEIAKNIAIAIIEREKQKVITRQQYQR